MSPLSHEESWLQLPWLANGRLASERRAELEAHVRECSACAQELRAQRQLCAALTEPERVSYAAAPSFRKLMQRIDAPSASRAAPPARAPRAGARPSAAWRPPGLAWAATFILTVGMGLMVAGVYHWSQPLYVTSTRSAPAPTVLHIAFERSLPVGEVEQVLNRTGARVVEGPGSSGVFGVVPRAAAGASADRSELRALAQRLHADPGVRWVEPIASSGPPEDQ